MAAPQGAAAPIERKPCTGSGRAPLTLRALRAQVINGCSDLFVAVLGENGCHARSAVGMGSLPENITVEIEVVIRVLP
jgi:enamine deaminase RidA (YjgF/YER057c/UK114 family)